MSAVFGHGRLRLYLLKLLDEEPRHGYDVIRSLEDRFMGVYAPSAGTVYPRLNRLEDEGLVRHEVVEGRKVYHLTDAGRQELAERREELEALERDIARSVRELAREVREDVRSSVRSLREELKTAAREVRDSERERRREERRSPGPGWTGPEDIPGWADAREAMRQAAEAFRAGWPENWERYGERPSGQLTGEVLRTAEMIRHEVRRAVKSRADDEALGEMRAVLDEALARVRDLSRR